MAMVTAPLNEVCRAAEFKREVWKFRRGVAYRKVGHENCRAWLEPTWRPEDATDHRPAVILKQNI